MKFRAWLSILTLALIALIIYLARHELVDAWHTLEKVNLWILALLIPAQVASYYAGGEIMFSYLREKKRITHVAGVTMARMALEMNFVNHILPSGGVSGMSYMTWRLGRYGVSAGRATMAQMVRYVMTFAAFAALLVIAVVIVTVDGGVNRWIILMSSALVTGMVILVLGGVFVLSSRGRMRLFARYSARSINYVVRKVTFGRKKQAVTITKVETFFEDIHDDYVALRAEKRVLLKPFLWGLAFNVLDVLLFMITFWALGVTVNPAPILIAYGVASIAGFFVATPGGAGAYEVIMVMVLTFAGVDSGVAIAGIVLTRVVLLLGTIGFGYLFYQHAIIKYGKSNPPINR